MEHSGFALWVHYIYLHYLLKVFKEINTFIQQGYIILIKTDCKDIYNVTKVYLYFK